MSNSMKIENPLVIIFRHDDKIICHIHPDETDGYEVYGLLICDLVRHVANAFKVNEDSIWEWVLLTNKSKRDINRSWRRRWRIIRHD